MKASEANKLSSDVNKRKTEEAYRKIQALIKINADLGNYETYFYDNLDDTSKKMLEEDGFIINHIQTGMNEYSYLIKW
jgi:hypothetical protein